MFRWDGVEGERREREGDGVGRWGLGVGRWELGGGEDGGWHA